MSTSEKAELSMSICHIEKVSKSGIPIYSSTAFDMADRETATTGNCKALCISHKHNKLKRTQMTYVQTK